MEINMKKIVQEWENLKNDKKLSKSILSDSTYNSWLRCLDYGLIPDRTEIIRVSTNELKRRKEDNKILLDTAMPIAKHFYDTIKGSGSVVILTDSSGIILESFGDQDFVEEILISKPGTSWREDALGTNGVGTALFLKQPVQIKGAEHFYKSNHLFSCSAAPILDCSGKVIGCIDLSTRVENVQSHTLGMVVLAAYAVNRQLGLNEALSNYRKTLTEQEIIVEMMTSALISVDRELRVVQTNTEAKEMLSLQGAVRGQRLEDVLKSKYNWQELVVNNKKLYDVEISLKVNRKSVISIISSSLVYNDSGDFSGMIITLKPKSRVYKSVNKYSGSTAMLTFDDLIGVSTSFKRAIEMAEIAGRSSSNVLLLGESGTGKELFAQSIHNDSSRVAKPFIAVNCGALPRELVQTELFGYVGGAYTGSLKEGHPGKFELADGGTIFLDEIGDMPLEAQANLLRVLQNREVIRVGGSDSFKVDVRVIAATNKDLPEMISEKMFREDLFYRLNVLTIDIPPLRERTEDLVLLTEHFLKKHGARLDKQDLIFDSSASARLENYSFPGNIRELENIIESAVNITKQSVINENCLPERICGYAIKKVISEKRDSFDNIKDKMILESMQKCKGNVSKAAKFLGISRGTIYLYLKKQAVDPETFRVF